MFFPWLFPQGSAPLGLEAALAARTSPETKADSDPIYATPGPPQLKPTKLDVAPNMTPMSQRSAGSSGYGTQASSPNTSSDTVNSSGRCPCSLMFGNGRTQSLSPYISDFLNKYHISHAFIISQNENHFVL